MGSVENILCLKGGVTSCLGTGVENSTTHPVGDAGRYKSCTVSDGVVGLGHVYLRTQLDKVEERARTWSSSQESDQWRDDNDESQKQVTETTE